MIISEIGLGFLVICGAGFMAIVLLLIIAKVIEKIFLT